MKLSPENVLMVKGLWVRFEKEGAPCLDSDFIGECDSVWKELCPSVRGLVDAMIGDADQRAAVSVAELEEHEVLSALSEEVQVTLTRLITLMRDRWAVFTSARLTIHPRSRISQGVARAQEGTKHYETTRKRGSKAGVRGMPVGLSPVSV